jgi:hypothetical protein
MRICWQQNCEVRKFPQAASPHRANQLHKRISKLLEGQSTRVYERLEDKLRSSEGGWLEIIGRINAAPHA